MQQVSSHTHTHDRGDENSLIIDKVIVYTQGWIQDFRKGGGGGGGGGGYNNNFKGGACPSVIPSL